ncbi:hypothetical protein [Oceanobacillus senegalensis]|nr:hypothetical protein [Oceanobacillus senegalensis]
MGSKYLIPFQTLDGAFPFLLVPETKVDNGANEEQGKTNIRKTNS